MKSFFVPEVKLELMSMEMFQFFLHLTLNVSKQVDDDVYGFVF